MNLKSDILKVTFVIIKMLFAAKVDQLANEGRLKKYRNGSLVRFKKSEVLSFYKTFQKWERGW